MNAIIPISSRRTVTEFCQYPPRLVKKQHQPLTSPVVTMIKGKTVYTSKSAYSKGKLKPEFAPFADFEIVDRYTFRVWTPAHVTSNKIIPLPAQTPQTIRLLPAPKMDKYANLIGMTVHVLGSSTQCKIERVFDQFDGTWVQMRHPYGVITRRLSQIYPKLEA